MKFNFEDYKGNYVMHCETEEESRWFCKLMHKDGRRWYDNSSYLESNLWSEVKEDTVYFFNKGYYGNIISVEEEGDYVILEASDFIDNESKPFTKSDLKAGMLVELVKGDLCLLIPNQETLMFISKDFIYKTNLYEIDELFNEDDVFSIKKIYGLSSNGRLFDITTRDLLWEFKSPRKVTHQELRELLGEDFEIID